MNTEFMKRATPQIMINLIFLLIAPEVYGQEVSQNDFYGTWVFEYYEDFEFLYVISSQTLTQINNLESRIWSYRILSWRSFINNDIDTKNDYPLGFVLTLLSTNTAFDYTVLIHREKNKIIFQSLPSEIYIKLNTLFIR